MELIDEYGCERRHAGPDKRASDRIRSFLRAQIIFNNRMTTIDCIIKNISATGARVALNDTLAVPTEFDIYIPQRGCSHHARLVWRDRDTIGIDFMDVQQPTPLQQCQPPPRRNRMASAAKRGFANSRFRTRN